jgi:3-hydroxyacyl-CoA dehydrogenase/enoyl-CoA hydratase/3-hydroxybutyryl-CoA epimerase
VDGKPQKDKSKAGPTDTDLQDRLILPMLNEAVAVLREQIVADAELLDAGVIFGTGFAPFRGGPVNYIRSVGVDALKARLEKQAQKHGERFKPDTGWSAPALREPKA